MTDGFRPMARGSWLAAAGLVAGTCLATACATGGPAPGPSADSAPPGAQAPPGEPAPEVQMPPDDPSQAAPPPADQAQTTPVQASEAASAEPTAPVTGIYSAAQAERGEDAFDETCATCHATSEFRGDFFQRNWGRRTVYSFFRTVRSTMPDDNPGGLDEQTYLDVVSYIMRMNGHEAGPSEMLPDSPMREVRMDPSGSSG